jgi:hypothetical protein
MFKRTLNVNSSMLNSIGYNLFNRKLTAEFKNGVQYTYYGVQRSDWKLLRSTHKADNSVGKVFDLLIKKGGYDYDRLGVFK